MFNIPSGPIPRRMFLRGAGVALALPYLEAMWPLRAYGREENSGPPSRLVCICTTLGLHAPYFVPTMPGREYPLTPYLEPLKDFRSQFTVFSGLSHPEVSGSNGHDSEAVFLTAARHPGLNGFRNSISMDQWISEKIGFQTRFPSLTLGTSDTSQSYTRGGVMISAETMPSRVFARLFLDGNAEEVQRQMRAINDGRSIMDTVGAEAKRLEKRMDGEDRRKLDEYFTSVREMEQRLTQAEEWSRMPKPKVNAKPPEDVADQRDLIGRMRLLFDLTPLALQTDSTRLITIMVSGRNDVPPVPGVSVDHHNLSHHGQDAGKIKQLKLIEDAEMAAFASLLSGLKSKTEGAGSLLDRTTVLFGSNLGNANAHDTLNLPILVAGGRFRHGQHLAFDSKNNVPLSNLFVSLLQGMGIETDKFGTSTKASVNGFEAT